MFGDWTIGTGKIGGNAGATLWCLRRMGGAPECGLGQTGLPGFGSCVVLLPGVVLLAVLNEDLKSMTCSGIRWGWGFLARNLLLFVAKNGSRFRFMELM